MNINYKTDFFYLTSSSEKCQIWFCVHLYLYVFNLIINMLNFDECEALNYVEISRWRRFKIGKVED